MIRPLSILTVILGMLVWATSAIASPETDILEIETNKAADRALKQTEAMATAISFAFDYLATFLGETGPPPAVIQAELKATAARLEGVRSILVINKDGTLLHDAFSYPPPAVNLATRSYMISALENPGVQFGKAIIGRTSGIPFAPLSAFKPSLNAVFAAIMDLRKIREPLNWCLSVCGGAVLTAEGNMIAASPPETTLPDDLIAEVLKREETEGSFLYHRANLSALIAFRKSQRFPVIIVTSRVIANTTSPVTE